MNIDERCENCKFWLRDNEESDTGVCRKSPPERMQKVWHVEACFPDTCETTWCGEWKDKKVK